MDINGLRKSIQEDSQLSQSEKTGAILSLTELDNLFGLESLSENNIITTMLSKRFIYSPKWLIYVTKIFYSLRNVDHYGRKIRDIKEDRGNNSFFYLLELEVAYKLLNKYSIELDPILGGTTPDISATSSDKNFIIEVTGLDFSMRRKKADKDYLWISSYLMGLSEKFKVNGTFDDLLLESDKNGLQNKFEEFKTTEILEYSSNQITLDIRSADEGKSEGLHFNVYKDIYLLHNLRKRIEEKAQRYAGKCNQTQELVLFIYCTEIYHYVQKRANLISMIEDTINGYEKLTAVILYSYDFGWDVATQDKMELVNGHLLARTTREDRVGLWHWIISKNNDTEEILYNALVK